MCGSNPIYLFRNTITILKFICRELESKQSASVNLHFITLGGEGDVKVLDGVHLVDMESGKEVGRAGGLSVLIES